MKAQKRSLQPLSNWPAVTRAALAHVLPALLVLVCALALVVRLSVQDRLSGAPMFLFYATPPVVISLCLATAALWWWVARRRLPAVMATAAALACAVWTVAVTCRFNRPVPHAGTSCRILFWNVAAGRSGWERLADYARRQRPDVIGLVEAGQDLSTMQAVWAQHLPDYQASVFETGITVLSRSSLRVVAASTLATWGRYVHVALEGTGSPLHILVFDALQDWHEARGAAMQSLYQALEPLAGKPVVVVGDFNLPVESFLLRPLRREYTNAFEVAGWGYAATWPVPLPVLTIDQAWVSPAVQVHSCRHSWSLASDHRPVILEVSVAEALPAAAPNADLDPVAGPR